MQPVITSYNEFRERYLELFVSGRRRRWTFKVLGLRPTMPFNHPDDEWHRMWALEQEHPRWNRALDTDSVFLNRTLVG